jgi:hypothetical protein
LGILLKHAGHIIHSVIRQKRYTKGPAGPDPSK